MQIDNSFSIREVTANRKRIFRFDRDVEFPIAQRRSFNRIVRPVFNRLRRGPARQSDRNQIDVFKEMTVGQRDISLHRRAHHRPGNFQIRVGPRGE